MQRFRLRTKAVCLIGLIITIVMSASTFVHIREVKQNYLEAVEWRSEALGMGIMSHLPDDNTMIKGNAEDMQAFWEGLSSECERLYHLSQQDGVTHIAIVNPEGKIVAHNNKEFLNTSLNSSLWQKHLQQKQLIIGLHDTIYQTFIPIIGADDDKTYLGSINIGFSEDILAHKLSASLLQFGKLLGFFLILAVFIVPFLVRIMLMKPVSHLVATGQQLSEGKPVKTFHSYAQGGELRDLETVFQRISVYVQHIADIATRIASGILDSDMHVRSEHDVLGKAVHGMLCYLKQIAHVATKIAEGDLSEDIPVRTSEDALGRSIQMMMDGLRALVVQIRVRTEEMTTIGENISSLAVRDTDIVKNVNTSAEHMMSTMHEVGSSIEEVAQNMELLSSAMEQTSTSVSQMTLNIEDIVVNINELTRQTQQAMASQDESVTSLERVSESTITSQTLSQETIQYALDGQQSVEHVMNGMEELQQTITIAVNAITNFAKRSQDIGKILDVIRDIADRTKLLALNASIIAAQAGVHGKGFAVVSDEIKELADGVTTSITDIAKIVESLQQDTNNVAQTIYKGAENAEQNTTRTRHAQEALQKISDSVQNSSSLVIEIADAIHELKSNSYSVTTDMELINVMTDDITRATQEQKSNTTQINEAIEHINEMAVQIQHATIQQTNGIQHALTETQNVSSLMTHNLDSSQHIAETAAMLVSQANVLLNSVAQFKLKT